MQPYLKAYDSNGKLLATGHEVIGDRGSVIIPNLAPHTTYPEGSFYISWQAEQYETEKVAVPEFTTHESTYKEFAFYFKDHIVVKTKTAYDIAVDNGFTGTEEEWVASIKGEPGKDSNPIEVAELTKPYVEQIAGEEFEKLSTAKQQDSEVINARKLSNSLSEELTRIDNKVYTKNTNKIRPMVSFYLDDGYQNDYDIVYPKAKSLNIPLTICLFNTSALLTTPERLTELTDNGWEIHAHTATHPELNTLTLDQQRKEMRDNITHFKGIGYDLKGICYPKGYTNSDTLKASREYFEVGMSSIAGINYSPIDTYYVNRVLVNEEDMSSVRAYVDKIKADGRGWIVFYSHSNAFNTDIEAKNKFFEAMDYVKESGVETVTVNEAMKVYGNTLDIGDEVYSDNFFKLGGDGNINTSNMPVVYNKNISQINSKPFSEFATKKITVTSFELGNNSDIPIDSGIGTLYTDRRFEQTKFLGTGAHQKFEGFRGTVVTRQWETNKWSEWTTLGSLNTVYKAYKNNTPILEFPKFKVTKTVHLANENTGFPEPIGTLETNRLSDNDLLNYQIFYPYNKNLFYKRYWTSSGWSGWGKTSTNVSISQNYDFGEIEANSTKAYQFTISDITNSDMPNINFISGLHNGLIPMIYTAGNNNVVVKLLNTTGAKISIGIRPILITILKG